MYPILYQFLCYTYNWVEEIEFPNVWAFKIDEFKFAKNNISCIWTMFVTPQIT